MSVSKVPKPPFVDFPDTLCSFRTFCQKTLPAVYDDSLSYYEVICRVRDILNQNNNATNELGNGMKELYEYVDQLYHYMSDDPASQFINQLEEYIDDHLIDYVARMAYYVFPTLQKFGDGTWHYCIKVPQSWKQLHFGWIFDTTDHTWHIVLNY